MSGNDISQRYLELIIPEIERVTCIKPILWEATIPETLPHGPLQFLKTKPTIGTPEPRNFTETEKAVWYSHLTLWKHIFNHCESAWIFEHDIDLSQIVLLPEYVKDIVTVKGSGSLDCYYLTKKGATILYHLAISSPIFFQVDGFVASMIRSRKYIKEMYFCPKLPVKQLTNFGTTIDHQPSSATSHDQE